ncbi:MGMT family protein [Anaeropeptidivorans aminofermentans]|uniref:MGMT family protein n=1 Tax=Anaeropeptidivorans aminofermentans TaxID=2934315 RepID=UPI0020246103|nr:MGMT family protein [Anaeropeptidivorans aminofermentans]
MENHNTEFFNRIYDIVEVIPEGKVISYGEIAKILGRPRNARLVGTAMKNVPKERNLPCHRVVSKSGALAPGYVFESKEIQKALLISEGVEFDKKDRIKKEFFLDNKSW